MQFPADMQNAWGKKAMSHGDGPLALGSAESRQHCQHILCLHVFECRQTQLGMHQRAIHQTLPGPGQDEGIGCSHHAYHHSCKSAGKRKAGCMSAGFLKPPLYLTVAMTGHAGSARARAAACAVPHASRGAADSPVLLSTSWCQHSVAHLVSSAHHSCSTLSL